MYEYEYTRTVPGKTPQDCFDVITDASRGAEWVGMASEVRPEGEPGVGRKIVAKAGMMGVHLDITSEVYAWEEPTRYAWRSEKPVYSDFDFTFTEQDGGTRIDAKLQFDPGKVFKFGTGKVAAKKFAGDFEGDLDRLVKMIERS